MDFVYPSILGSGHFFVVLSLLVHQPDFRALHRIKRIYNVNFESYIVRQCVRSRLMTPSPVALNFLHVICLRLTGPASIIISSPQLTARPLSTRSRSLRGKPREIKTEKKEEGGEKSFRRKASLRRESSYTRKSSESSVKKRSLRRRLPFPRKRLTIINQPLLCSRCVGFLRWTVCDGDPKVSRGFFLSIFIFPLAVLSAKS